MFFGNEMGQCFDQEISIVLFRGNVFNGPELGGRGCRPPTPLDAPTHTNAVSTCQALFAVASKFGKSDAPIKQATPHSLRNHGSIPHLCKRRQNNPLGGLPSKLRWFSLPIFSNMTLAQCLRSLMNSVEHDGFEGPPRSGIAQSLFS